MTLKQLRYLAEIVRQDFHLSRAANVLHTSQPGVSRQIQLLEDELHLVIFKRKKNRILGLTQPGRQIFEFAQDVLQGVRNIKDIGEEHSDEAVGSLIVATTHTQARYMLPPIVRRFSARFPRVQLEFWQGSRQEMWRLVAAGKADMAISTDCQMRFEDVVLLPCGKMRRIVVTQPDHPLAKRGDLTLRSIARYPIITYGFDNHGRWRLRHVFEQAGLDPKIVFSAADADICKAYVELGLGIAVIASIAYDPKRDRHLTALDAHRLFGTEPVYLAVNRGQFLRGYAYEFMNLVSPTLIRERVQRLMNKTAGTSARRDRRSGDAE